MDIEIMKTAEVVNKYERLLSEKPRFHAIYGNGKVLESNACNWGIGRGVLDWFMDNLDSNAKTLETGCGYSTVTFLMLGTEHVVVSPYKEEHDAIREWCNRNQIATEHAQFVAEGSQEVIPLLQNGPQLDLVLVDGDHSFPVPFLDWYHTANRVKKGGHVIIDDTHLVTGTILREFLKAERGRWSLVRELGRTAVFRKETEDSVLGVWWGAQPFCIERKRGVVRRARRKLGRLLVHPDDVLWWD